MHFDFCPLTFAFAFCLFLTSLFLQPPSYAQQPYAAINPAAVNYSGAGRDAGHDLSGPEIRVGLLAPLTGTRQPEGEALRRAAEMAIEEENTTALSGGRHLALVARDESGPWGRASSETVRMVFDDEAVAVITSSDGKSAHLAEQVANKIGVPILTLAGDSTTTEINLPWIFRVGASDAQQARLMARDIYQVRKLSRVLLVMQNDYDGRVGAEEFEKAARATNAPGPRHVIIDDPVLNGQGRPASELGDAQAVVLWTDAAAAESLLPRLREASSLLPIYLCRKAAQSVSAGGPLLRFATGASGGAGIWSVGNYGTDQSAQRSFVESYRQRFGVEPAMNAARVYDAVRLLAASLRQSGPNRARLRDVLANVSGYPGASGRISFDHAGNDTSPATLIQIQ